MARKDSFRSERVALRGFWSVVVVVSPIGLWCLSLSCVVMSVWPWVLCSGVFVWSCFRFSPDSYPRRMLGLLLTIFVGLLALALWPEFMSSGQSVQHLQYAELVTGLSVGLWASSVVMQMLALLPIPGALDFGQGLFCIWFSGAAFRTSGLGM